MRARTLRDNFGSAFPPLTQINLERMFSLCHRAGTTMEKREYKNFGSRLTQNQTVNRPVKKTQGGDFANEMFLLILLAGLASAVILAAIFRH